MGVDDVLLDGDGHPIGLSPEESRLASDYVYFLDLVSRTALALEHGEWSHLAEKAEDLSRATDALAVSATRADASTPSTRAGSVLAAVTARGWQLQAVQKLHPGPYGAARPSGEP